MSLSSGVGLFGIRLPEAPDPDKGKISKALIREFHSDDLQSRRTAITKIRKIQDAQPLIDAGLVPDIVSLLESEDAHIQLSTVPESEALRIVLGITYETTYQINIVVEAGTIPKLIRLSASPSKAIAVNAVSALANIVRDSPSLRDRVEEEGGIDAL
ncbi:Importin subunit alpha-4 [Tulasnella sp. 408]|nr:Importin subunit alpha-4 [Tulasnella sp. 408]